MSNQTGPGAVVAKREDRPPVDTDEIRALTTAAGHDVLDEVTQARPEDPGTYVGGGKLEALATTVEHTGAWLVVIDGELSPQQMINVREAMPASTQVLDRYHLILRLFAEQATTRRAQLQVELAQLRYERPRIEADADPQGMNVALEKGTIVDGVENRIAELERKLKELPNPAEQHRDRRREDGFDLVTIAGYTNAGKSTLLHRVADEMTLEADNSDLERPEKDASAAIEDRLFETLETTTRRATLDGRPALVTDTVGFVRDLPHWLVKSFSATLSEAAAADVVVLVVDVTDPIEELCEKTRVSLDVLSAQGVDESSVVTAVNKIDTVDDATRRERVDEVRSIAPAPIPVSARQGTRLAGLSEEVIDRLPTQRATLTVPNCSAAMELVSWAYDRTAVGSVSYAGTEVTIELSGRPELVEQAIAKAEDVRNC
jgi:GTP-binding protein HflX